MPGKYKSPYTYKDIDDLLATAANVKAAVTEAQSWSSGGTGTRPDEDSNNARYWASVARQNAGGDYATLAEAEGLAATAKAEAIAAAANKDLSNLTNYQKALRNIGGRPNKNLIVNHYMIGTGDPGSFPINQRGQKVYTPDWNKSAFDQWGVEANQELKIEIKEGFVTVTNTSTERTLQFKHHLVYDLIVGEEYTLSAYIKSASDNVTLRLGMTDPPYTGVCLMTVKANSISYASVKSLPQVSSGGWKVFYTLPPNGHITIADQKLEHGPIQTLGWEDDAGVHLFETSDYGDALAQCQRQLYIPATGTASTYYSVVVNPTSGDIFFPVILPVPMRTTPVIAVAQATLYVGNEQKTVTPSAVTCYGLRGNQAMCRANGVAAGVSAKTGIVEIGGLQISAELVR